MLVASSYAKEHWFGNSGPVTLERIQHCGVIWHPTTWLTQSVKIAEPENQATMNKTFDQFYSNFQNSRFKTDSKQT